MTVPSLLNAGFRLGIFAMSHVNGVSSFATTRSPLRSLTVTGAISRSKCFAFDGGERATTDSAANSSWCWRVNPYFFAVASAKMPHHLAVEWALQTIEEHVIDDLRVAHAVVRRAPSAADRARWSSTRCRPRG